MTIRNVLFKYLDGTTAVLQVSDDRMTGEKLRQLVFDRVGTDCPDIRLTWNGKILPDSDEVLQFSGSDVYLQLYIPCPGGKGGFGSMLRAIGAQIEKTTNKDACRDLSGRRLRDVNAEKKLKEYIAKAAKRKELEKKKRKEKLLRLRREPKIEFKDEEYFKSRSELPEIVDDAVTQGMRKVLAKTTPCATVTSATCTSSSSDQSADDSIPGPSNVITTIATIETVTNSSVTRKESANCSIVKPKKKLKPRLWLGIDEEESISTDDE